MIFYKNKVLTFIVGRYGRKTILQLAKKQTEIFQILVKNTAEMRSHFDCEVKL